MGGKGTFSKHIIYTSLLLIQLFYPEPLILQAAMAYLLVNFFFNFEIILNLKKSQKE